MAILIKLLEEETKKMKQNADTLIREVMKAARVQAWELDK